MNTRTIAIILISIVALFFLSGFLLLYSNSKSQPPSVPLNESSAILTIKNKYPIFNDYPNIQLPPKSIKTEADNNGWYVAFIQEGSGAPIEDAKCFYIDQTKSISEIEYIPTKDPISTKFSPKECRLVETENIVGNDRDIHGCIGSAGYSWCEIKQKCIRPWEEDCEDILDKNSDEKCVVENCHGMDIRCGPNAPEMCTAEFQTGDICLEYAKCGFENGVCQQIQNEKFDQCKSCVQKCEDTYELNPDRILDCVDECR